MIALKRDSLGAKVCHTHTVCRSGDVVFPTTSRDNTSAAYGSALVLVLMTVRWKLRMKTVKAQS